MASKSGAIGGRPSLVVGGVGSGVAGRALSAITGSNGEVGVRGVTGRLSFRGGRRVSPVAAGFAAGGVLDAAAAASSFRLASRAFARTALAGSSSSSCLPYVGVSGSSGFGIDTGRTALASVVGAGVTLFSSASSVISFNLRRRREELEEVNDEAEGSSMVHRPRADSVSSAAAVKEKTVSCGVKVSRTD